MCNYTKALCAQMFSGRIEDIQEIEEQQATIIAQMDFIENRLGQEFINIVGEWVETLEKAYIDKNKLILKLKKHRKLVGYYFNYTLFGLASISALFGFNYYMSCLQISSLMELSTHHFQFIVNYAVVTILLCLFLLKRGEAVANKVFRYLSEYGESFVFKITKGDENAYNRIVSEDKESAVKIFLNLVFSLLLNVGCSIIASVLYSRL